MPISDDLDRRLRTAAFIEVRRMLELRDPLKAADLARGFQFEAIVIPAAAVAATGRDPISRP